MKQYLIFTLSFFILSCTHVQKRVDTYKLYEGKEIYEIIDTYVKEEFELSNPIIIYELKRIYKQSTRIDSNGNVIADAPPPPPGSEYYYEKDLFDSLRNEKLLTSIEIEYMYNQFDSSFQYCLDSTKTKYKILSDSIVRTFFVGNKKSDPYELLEKEYNSHFFIRFSTPIISQDRKKVLLDIDFHCGELCGGGETLLFEKVKGDWKIVYRKSDWVS